jgi:uncharacterized membrane protein
MTLLIAGLVIFLGAHSARIVPGLYGKLAGQLGEVPYKAVYSVVSLVGLVLIWKGFAAARDAGQPILYSPPVWMQHITLLLMMIALVCLVAAYVPSRIKAALKHPMLVAIKIWALAHLLANGELHSVIVFGSFLAWAVLDRISVKRRERAGLAMPYVHKPGTPVANDLIVVVLGATAYVAIALWLHPILFGVVVMG